MDGRVDRSGAVALTVSRVALDRGRPYKPLDVGNGVVAGTVTPAGRWLSLGTTHPVHGRVVLTDAPAFDASRRSDQAATRAYRGALAAPGRLGFGIDGLGAARVSAYLVEDALPLALHERPDGTVSVLTLAPPGRAGACQVVRIERGGRSLAPFLSGAYRLARSAYTQLTPGGPLPPVEERPVRGSDGDALWIEDESLEAAAAIVLERPPGADGAFVLAIALAARRGDAIREARAIAAEAPRHAAEVQAERRSWWTAYAVTGPTPAPVRRAVSYALDCARSRVSAASDAILADHEILPLVWTRDAYYVCRALLGVDPRGRGATLSARFLAWCFETAERPDGWWPRASLASGQVKDPVFQLDQQLYPLLLLEDHARLAGDDAPLRRYRRERDAVLRALLDRRSALGLVATAETPADDPLDLPFHFSSHVLLWRVLRDVDRAAADAVRSASLARFALDDVYAYAIGDTGAARRYHDANDLPTVFAPGWGFCPPDDPRWRATVAFAWTTANPGFFPGRLGGLGSLHTPHPWPLGDLQELVLGRLLGDEERSARAAERLRQVRTWDGLLPEAYHEETGAVASRHWFAWPIALWALLEREPSLVAP